MSRIKFRWPLENHAVVADGALPRLQGTRVPLVVGENEIGHGRVKNVVQDGDDLVIDVEVSSTLASILGPTLRSGDLSIRKPPDPARFCPDRPS